MKELRNQFVDRDDLIAYLRGEFADVCCDDRASETVGTCAAADALLGRIDVARYEHTRNFLDGAVTKLSPYLRHGVVSLAEVRDRVFALDDANIPSPKLITELAWRDYWQRVYAFIGEAVWDDIESYKTGYESGDYADELPGDLSEGKTDLACIDAFARDLVDTGYVHNHARMWLAAYLVHFRKINWRVGATWFLQHLLDGDVASNNLSWQWVASTFGSKPYFMNRENIERYTAGKYCENCPSKRRCPFDASYESLAAKLFRPVGDSQPGTRVRLRTIAEDARFDEAARDKSPVDAELNAVAWIHQEAISASNPVGRAVDPSRRVWVWDEEQLRRDRPSLKRIVFQTECAIDAGVRVYRGTTCETLKRITESHSTRTILTTPSPSRAIGAAVDDLRSAGFEVRVLSTPEFVSLPGPVDLGRFSRYWKRTEAQLQKRGR